MGILFADFHMKIDGIFGLSMRDMKLAELEREEEEEEAIREGKGKKIEVVSCMVSRKKIEQHEIS
jgi:hypothetical protein